MYLINSGTLTLSVPVTDEILEKAQEYIGGIIRGDETSLAIEESYGDIEKDLTNLVDALVEDGITVEGSVNYYGDYEGRYDVCATGVTPFDRDAVAIRDADDATLIAELESRGFIVTKKEDAR